MGRTLVLTAALLLGAVAATPASGDVSAAITSAKARSAIKHATGGTVTKCRRKTERKIVCSVRKDGETRQYMAYRDSKGHVAVKRVHTTGNGPGAPLT